MDEDLQLIANEIDQTACKSVTFERCCVVCNSKAIGTNFGVLTCAPCKAFFRRNARRKELLEANCRYRHLTKLSNDPSVCDDEVLNHFHARRCSACRLRRCFDMGMKPDLIRTEEENANYRRIIMINRQRKEVMKQKLFEQKISNNNNLLDETDWRHLSNITFAYDSRCVKTFIEQRSTLIFSQNLEELNEQSASILQQNFTTCIVLGMSSFIRSLPAYCNLSRPAKNYLCKANIGPLIFPNNHELNQSCFSELWQETAYNHIYRYMCGSQSYDQFEKTQNLASKLWITDPLVTRLLLIILFFSTPLHYHHDGLTPTPLLKKNLSIFEIQNAYTTLLWKYLLHRHGQYESVRIYTNLMRVYLKMQTVQFDIYTNLVSQKDFSVTREELNSLITTNLTDE